MSLAGLYLSTCVTILVTRQTQIIDTSIVFIPQVDISRYRESRDSLASTVKYSGSKKISAGQVPIRYDIGVSFNL